MKDYIDQMLNKFNGIDSKQYPILDRQIGDVLHQVYKPKLESSEKLSSLVFKIIDKDLGQKKLPAEAKNYKKILSAVQKAKIMHPVELSTLFAKANKFLTKESVKKEKEIIKKEIKEKVMVEGPSLEDKRAEDEEQEYFNMLEV